MKIGILTHYNVSSHGAYLQLYAMSRILQERGHEPFVLTYRKNFDFAEEDAYCCRTCLDARALGAR